MRNAERFVEERVERSKTMGIDRSPLKFTRDRRGAFYKSTNIQSKSIPETHKSIPETRK